MPMGPALPSWVGLINGTRGGGCIVCAPRQLWKTFKAQLIQHRQTVFSLFRPEVRDGGERRRGRRRSAPDGAGVAAAQGQPGHGRLSGEHAANDTAMRGRKFDWLLLSINFMWFLSVPYGVG